MVDRARRNRLADAVHALAAGLVSTYEFEDTIRGVTTRPATPPYHPDPALGPIAEAAWCLYDDAHDYRLSGRHRLAPDRRREVLRWVVFLRSDRPYEWPPFSLVDPALRPLPERLLTFFLFGIGAGRRLERRFAAWRGAGEYAVWPFLRRADFEAAVRRNCPFAAFDRTFA